MAKQVINKRLLRSKIMAMGMSQEEFGRMLGMSKNTVSGKINGRLHLYVCEVVKMCEILGITDSTEKSAIFLNGDAQ
ncbi:MAG: helix-turn-helix domain-containing protein [Oscillospiraceae bacterium]|nr:helix-turn-helix domain-containing protein [Oscillospiraceae bacterium]